MTHGRSGWRAGGCSPALCLVRRSHPFLPQVSCSAFLENRRARLPRWAAATPGVGVELVLHRDSCAWEHFHLPSPTRTVCSPSRPAAYVVFDAGALLLRQQFLVSASHHGVGEVLAAVASGNFRRTAAFKLVSRPSLFSVLAESRLRSSVPPLVMGTEGTNVQRYSFCIT